MRTVFVIAVCVGIALAGQSKIRGEKKSKVRREFELSFSQGGSATCHGDTINNCVDYTKSVCSNPDFTKWVADHCCTFCGVGGGSGGMPPAPQTTSGFNLVFVTNGGHQMGGGGSCQDAITTCASYTSAVCTDPAYSDWVHSNCAHFCNKCGGGGVPTGAPVPMGSTCQDKLSNCASYGADVCTNANYKPWATENCANYCHLCGSQGTGQVTAAPAPSVCMDKLDCSQYAPDTCTSASFAAWAKENCPVHCHLCGGGGTMTGGGTNAGGGAISGGTPMIGGGTMAGGCADVSSNCAQLNSGAHICTDSGAQLYAKQNCALTCNMCSSGQPTIPQMSGSTGSCSDKMPNCASYGAGVCSDATYSAWVSENCQAFCHKCSSGSTGPMSGAGAGGSITGQSSGCVYNGQVYSQGQTWRDACKFSCTCVDGSAGKYQCQQLCVTWDLPPQCTLNPPAAGKCCSTPNCPAGFNIAYPPGYVAN